MTADTVTFDFAPTRQYARDDGRGIVARDERVRKRIARDGIVGLGETYEEGLWSTEHLDELMDRVFVNSPIKLSSWVWAKLVIAMLNQRVSNRQTGRGAFRIGARHYDLGNDLFEAMLDESMTYTSGYWAHADNLNEAQEAKLDLICRKLDLAEGQRVLDIGCGWGNFAQHAAERYGAHVTGLTVSREQASFARERCAGLPVEIRVQDYREMDEVFDHVVSIEMIEAVGRKNLPAYFRVIDRSLRNDGRCVIQAISGDTLSRTSDRRLDQFVLWLLKHIFPDGYLPKEAELVPPSGTSLRVEDWHAFADDYNRTLLSWSENLENNWATLSDYYDEQFRRRWRFYLHGCAAAFRASLVNVYQIVYSKDRLARHQPVR